MPQGNLCFFFDVTLFIHYIIFNTESVNHLTRGRSVRRYSPHLVSLLQIVYGRRNKQPFLRLLLVSTELAGLFSLTCFFGQVFKDVDSFGFHSSCSLENQFLCVATGKLPDNRSIGFGVPSCLVGRPVRWARSISGTGTRFNLATRTFFTFSNRPL